MNEQLKSIGIFVLDHTSFPVRFTCKNTVDDVFISI